MDRERHRHIDEPQDPALISAGFHPAVRAWWQGRFNDMTQPQKLAVPAIARGEHTLVCAPTGSGKTLAAFISVLSDLFTRRDNGTLGTGIQCVYVSPLKALGSDVTKNLLVPLNEIAALSPGTPITISQRTGDTTPADRARMLKSPPHILITTPESLALCLAQGLQSHLTSVRTIIIDELHSLAPNKRGVDLALSMERLAMHVMKSSGADPQRIGLSATIAPLERMADFLVGPTRLCSIADATFDRPLELDTASVFTDTPFVTSATINRRVYETLEEVIKRNRTTLVFTNVRSATERVTFQLRKRFESQGDAAPVKPEQIEAHHSSLDKERRLEIEHRLKTGQLRCVVCSTSLELGVDIGTIDQVVLLNSTKGVARGLQRVGRSGHSHGATARGLFIPTVPADLLECLITADAMKRRALDPIRVPQNCLDVLTQHVIGMAVSGGAIGCSLDEAYDIARATLPFATLARADFDACIHFLTQPLCDDEPITAKLTLERDRLRITRRGVAGLYYQNVGTITAEGQIHVRIENGASLGTVEEAFAQILKPGDRFVLGGQCVRFVRAEKMTALVAPSDGQSPTVPRWFSGAMSLEQGLAAQMRAFRAKVRAIAPAGETAIARMLMRQHNVNEQLANAVAAYLNAQARYADIPVDGHLLVERVPDDLDDQPAMALVFHTMVGRAANEALARLVAYRMFRRFAGNATVVVDDYAFGVWVSQVSAARRADRTLIRSLLSPDRFEEELAAALDTSELFRMHFRYTALRAHAIVQNRFGQRKFIGQMQGHATRLLDALRQVDPDHLLIRETRRTVLHDVLNTNAAREFLVAQANQSLRLVDLPSPSPFAFGLFATGGRRDNMQLADTSDFLLAMYNQVQQRLRAQPAPAPEPAGLFT